MVELDKHHSDRKGNLTVVENGQTLPFDVKRVYYLYDVPGGENRGSHAHKELSQLIIAVYNNKIEAAFSFNICE